MAQSQRPAKHVRRQSTEDSIDESDPEESGSDDWEPQSAGTIRVGKNVAATSSPAPMSGRPRRSAAAPVSVAQSSSVTVSRSNTPEERRRSIKLTVKLPSSKLREVMTERDIKALKATLVEGEYWAKQPEEKLRKRTQKNYKIPEPSDEDDEDEEVEDAGDDEVDEPMNDFAEIGAEAESSEEEDADGDVDEDVEMDEPTLPPPKIKLKQSAMYEGKLSKPTLVVTPAGSGPLSSVRQKEADVDAGDEEEGEEDDEEDDEDLSELDSDDEERPDETNLDEEGEGEGEEDDGEGGEDLDGEEGDAELDSDGMTPGSGAATPDLAKMTKRQRRDDEGFMALDMAPQIKKHFTQEEQNMRRSEMARRRKNLSEKKVMEEKESTINKLLKKQTARRRGANAKPETLAAAVAAVGQENESPIEEPVEKANPLYTRWVSNKDGIRLGVPEEWLGKHVGRVFGPPNPMRSGRMVEEIE